MFMKYYIFHKFQAESFKQTNVDFLFAGVLPAKSEAIGMAKAMSETGIPCILSFVIRKSGSLLDGNIINDVISEIDNTITLKPLCYMVNCVHPTVLQEALLNPRNKTALGKGTSNRNASKYIYSKSRESK